MKEVCTDTGVNECGNHDAVYNGCEMQNFMRRRRMPLSEDYNKGLAKCQSQRGGEYKRDELIAAGELGQNACQDH